MRPDYSVVNDAMRGFTDYGKKVGKGIRFANQPGAKMLRKFLRAQLRTMVRHAMMAKFKKMPDCEIGHRIDMVDKSWKPMR